MTQFVTKYRETSNTVQTYNYHGLEYVWANIYLVALTSLLSYQTVLNDIFYHLYR